MPVDPKLVRDLFLSAADLSKADRTPYLQANCQGDEELRAAVERLLAAHEAPASVLNQPAPGMPTADYPGISERPGSMIGPYKLMEKIGEGGFGLVFVAEQTEPVKRKVALKVIKPGMDSKQVIARFEAERQALAMMDHPNIARVLDAGTTETGRPYFVMELVRGIPITDYCDQNHLTPAERLELFISVCHAIQHAHQKGIIHRDIKPSNVLVTSHDGKPVAKVIDFGVAKAIHQHLTERTIYTQFAQMIGTPLYMSPEQAEMSGLDIDTRSDIYSLGVLLYELLTGSTPLERKRLAQAAYDEIRRAIREDEPQRPSDRLSTSDTLPSLAASRKTEPARLSRMLKGELDWIVMKALEKDRTRRYETANGFARDIQRYLSDEVVEARPASAGYRLRKLFARNKGKVVAATLILLALLVGVAGSTWQAIRATRAEQFALAAAEEERQAKQREAERAEGERQAKLEAETKRKEAEQNLDFARKGNEILGSVFSGLDPKANYSTVGELSQALKNNLKKAAHELEGTAIGDRLTVAEMQFRLGASLIGLGDPGQAIPLFQKSYDSMKALLGPDHHETLLCLNNLGTAYRDSGNYEKALIVFEESYRLHELRLGVNHPNTLLSMSNLAVSYRDAGRFEQAISLDEKVFNLRKATLGPHHPDSLLSMITMAENYRKSNQVDRAIQLFEEVLRMRKATLGPDHPDIFIGLAGLARSYSASGQHERALTLYEQAYQRIKSKFGSDHPHTLTSMGDLADGYAATGKVEEALKLFEEVVKLEKAKNGPDHPRTLTSINNLACHYWSQKQLDKSIPLFEELVTLYAKKLGRANIATLSTIANLGVNYKDAGRLAESIPLLEEAYLSSKNDVTLRWIGQQFLDALVKGNQLTKSLKLIDELLALDRQSFPKESLPLASHLVHYGSIMIELKCYSDAEPLLRECLAIREKQQPDVWATFNTQSYLGGALLGQKKYTDAEPLLLKGYEGMKTREKTIPKTGGGELRLPEALDRLIQLYTETNKPEEVKKWQAEKDKLPKPVEKKN